MSKNTKTTWTVHADGRGVARQYDESMQEAIGVVDKYVQDGDVDHPHFEAMVESLAQGLKDRGVRGELDELEDKVRSRLKDRCSNESTMYPAIEKTSKAGASYFPVQHVYLDLDDVAGSLNRTWALPVPSIVFAMLDERDSLYGPDSKGIAVYFNPHIDPKTGQSDPAKLTNPRYISWDKQQVCVPSDWDPACYEGVVRTFPSYTAMKQARVELVRAIELIKQGPPSDAEPDVFEDPEYLASLEDDAADVGGF